VLRLPMVYGPRDGQHRLWQFLGPMQEDPQRLELDAGTAPWRGARTFVDNAAAAIALCATDPRAAGRVYNVAEPEAQTELEWARLIAEAAAWHGKIVLTGDASSGPEPAQHLIVDSARIRDEVGYREVVSRDEALRQTVTWELEHRPA